MYIIRRFLLLTLEWMGSVGKEEVGCGAGEK